MKVWEVGEEPKKKNEIVTLRDKVNEYLEELSELKEIALKYDIEDDEGLIESFKIVTRSFGKEKFDFKSTIDAMNVNMDIVFEKQLSENEIAFIKELYDEKYIEDYEGELKSADSAINMTVALESINQENRKNKISKRSVNVYEELLDEGLPESDEMLLNIAERFKRIYKLEDIEEHIIENYTCGVEDMEKVHCMRVITKDLEYDYNDKNVNLKILNSINAKELGFIM